MAGEVVTLPETTIEGAAPEAPAAPGPALFNPFSGGDFVAVKNRDGSYGAVQTSDLDAAIATGSRPATRTEYLAAKGGTVGKVASAAIGIGRGAGQAVGLPVDAALIEGSRALGGDTEAEDTRRALNLARDANPGWNLGGELVGSLAGAALIPGGAGGAARGATAGARALSRVGQAAPRLLAEGALLGIGHQSTEDALGNHQLVAQQYVASAFKGAALALILGGAFHAGAGYVGDRLGSYVGRAAEAADESSFLGKLGRKAADEAEIQAFKATGAKLKDIERLGATAEAQAARQSRIGRRLLEDEMVGPLTTQEQLAKRVAVKLKEVGAELGSMRNALDKAETRPAMSNIVRRFEEEVLKPAAELPLGEAEARPAAEFLADMMKKGGETPDFKTLFKYRRALDTKLERGGEYARSALVPAKPGADGMRALRSIVEEEFEAAAEKAAAETGDSFGAKYKIAKEAYADYRTAQKILAKEVARGGANQAISLTDVISAVGGVASSGPAGAAWGAANHVRRKFGNQIAAHVLDKASQIAGIQRTAGANQEAIAAGVKGFLSNKAPKAATAGEQVTPETVRAVREAVRDPQAIVSRLDSALGGTGLNEAAPKVAQAVASTAMRAAGYLRDRTPKEPPPSGLSFVPQKPRAMSESELAKYANAYEAITNPMSIVEDLQRGQLDREKVNALRVVYPDLYQQIRKEVIAQSIAMKPELTDQQEIALSILFDAPISAMMQPKVISSFQKTFAQGADPSQAGQASGQPAPTARGLRRLPPMASGFDEQEAPT